MFFSFFFILSFSSFSNVLMDEVLTIQKKEFSIKLACEKTFNNDFPLVTIKSGTVIDCMGTELEAGTFCDKEMIKDPYYLRGYVDRNQKKIICQTGERVIFKYQCVKLTDKEICNHHPKVACENFQKKLAKKLDLIHFSQMKNHHGIPQVNCIYEAHQSEDKKFRL
jgi:hypothetical protein